MEFSTNVLVNLHYRLDVRKEASSMQSNSTEDHIWSDLQRNDSNNLEYNSEGLSPSGMDGNTGCGVFKWGIQN